MPHYLRQPLQMISGIFDRALCVIGAVLFAQFPQFYAQYIQRLGGHLDEARRMMTQYTAAAAANHLSLQEYIRFHLDAGNPVFLATGQLINSLVTRVAQLEAAIKALRETHPLARCWALLWNFDPDIAKQTWLNFTPGVPTTVEGIVYAIVGMVLLWGIYQSILTLFRRLFRKRLISPTSMKV